MKSGAYGYTWAFLARLGPARWPVPGPTCAKPAHGPYWTGAGRSWSPRKNFLARAQPEMLFLVTLHYKMRGRPAQARARPEPGPKTEAQHVPWNGHGQDFLGPKNPDFFRHGPNPPGPSPTRQLRPDTSHGTVVGRIFSARKTRIFFCPARTRPGPWNAQVYLRSIFFSHHS
jgi:hypothetical protein